jgi:hypothetical protein
MGKVHRIFQALQIAVGMADDQIGMHAGWVGARIEQAEFGLAAQEAGNPQQAVRL